jgi:hypothetical protein
LSKLTGRGGPGRGQGRHPNQLPSKRIVIHADESEYREIIENTTPRSRTEVLINEARKYNKSLNPTSEPPISDGCSTAERGLSECHHTPSEAG